MGGWVGCVGGTGNPNLELVSESLCQYSFCSYRITHNHILILNYIYIPLIINSYECTLTHMLILKLTLIFLYWYNHIFILILIHQIHILHIFTCSHSYTDMIMYKNMHTDKLLHLYCSYTTIQIFKHFYSNHILIYSYAIKSTHMLNHVESYSYAHICKLTLIILCLYIHIYYILIL